MEVPGAQWAVYLDVIERARRLGIENAIGGGLAVAAYTSQSRSTKDIDLYVTPDDRERMIDVVKECGLDDYYSVRPYDREWIFRSHRKEEVIVDIMWAMPNQRAQVDREWLSRARDMEINGHGFRVLPPEELIWAKLYVLQRDRCDWPDVLNLIYATSDEIDWDHLVRRMGEDAPLLGAVLTIFGWLCPARKAQLPGRVRDWLADADRVKSNGSSRAHLLDSRPWFALELQNNAGELKC